MRRLGSVVWVLGLGALVLGALVLGAVLPHPSATAAVPSCDGLPATIVGTAGDDDLLGTDGPDVVVLGAGNDGFTGFGGDDVVCGGPGNDYLWADGERSVDSTPGADRLYGDDGDDHLEGMGGDDVVDGGAGDDRIYEFYNVQDHSGLDGSDVLHGGAGYDSVDYYFAQGVVFDARHGTATTGTDLDHYDGVESVAGSTGDDVYRGTDAIDVFSGGGGRDDIRTYGGADAVGNGDPTVRHEAPVEGTTIDSGSGDDQLTVYGAGVRATAGPGDDEVTVEGASTVALGDGDDAGWGLGSAHLDGGGGDDRLIASFSGSPSLVGGAGADVFLLAPTSTGRPGAAIDGGPDVDELRVWPRLAARIDLVHGTATTAGAPTVRFGAVERFVGSRHGDVVLGSPRADVVHGLGGGDVIRGGAGRDRLYGDGGRDVLRGGDGDDALDGGAALDLIVGGRGSDRAATPGDRCRSIERNRDVCRS